MAKKVIVIGSGFAGLSTACFLAKMGFQVTVIEAHNQPGGRARKLQANGFTFDMGPSWYWMPDVFERFFAQFNKKVSDYYSLERLDPSYRIYWPDSITDIPANFEALQALFNQIEPGSGEKLDAFLKEAAYKYEVGINKLVFKPGQSIAEFLDIDLIKGIFKLDVFNSIKTHVHKHFKHPYLQQLMEFPVLFLGALPEKTPALYSLMNYADINGGTWYPTGGMYKIVDAMHQIATSLGVNFIFNHKVESVAINNKSEINTLFVKNIATNATTEYNADIVVGAADYHHIETKILPIAYQSYSTNYWNSRVMAPSCLLYYVGINKKLKNILHHTLFFDTSFAVHGAEIYTDKKWPTNPLFYVSATSVTDTDCAPENHENLFFLIPVATGLSGDTEQLRDEYFNMILKRFEAKIGENISEHIVYKKSYAQQNFIDDYNAFKGNAYGLANTLMQTAVLKPSCKSKKVKNLYYTGQLTVPGPGVPPSLISGEVVAKEILKQFG